jgi:chromosome partitioning protein
VLLGQSAALQAMRRTASGPDLLPANIDLSAAELELAAQIGRERFLAEALAPVTDQFDFILLDLPPSLGLLTVNGLVASSEVILPVQCEYLAGKALTLMLGTIETIRTKLNPNLRILGILPTMFNPRTLHANEVLEEIRMNFGVPVFAPVKHTVRFKEAPAGGLSILDYAPGHDGAMAYRALAKEVLS